MLADGEMLKERRSFLQHVAKLGGVNFRLTIDGAKKGCEESLCARFGGFDIGDDV